MQIKITTTFNISEANKSLIPLVCTDIGYEEWKKNTIQQALEEAHTENPEFLEEDLVIDTDRNTFMKFFLSNDASSSLKNKITPSVERYFGGVMQNKATAVKHQLDEAITTVVEIIE